MYERLAENVWFCHYSDHACIETECLDMAQFCYAVARTIEHMALIQPVVIIDFGDPALTTMAAAAWLIYTHRVKNVVQALEHPGMREVDSVQKDALLVFSIFSHNYFN